MPKSPIWIQQQVIIDLHDLQIKEHGGLIGIRDYNLLASALAQPQQKFSYQKETVHLWGNFSIVMPMAISVSHLQL